MILFLENVEPLYVVATVWLEADAFNEICPGDVIPFAIPSLIGHDLIAYAVDILNY